MLIGFLLFTVWFVLTRGDEMRQAQPERPFNLTCPQDQYVSAFSGDFTRDGRDRRRYRIQCAKLSQAGSLTCRRSRETDYLRYFENIGCDHNEYIRGIESTKFKDGDRKFRLLCCQSTDVSILEETCRRETTAIRENFTSKLTDEEVINKLSSKFTLWQYNGRFVVDRRWTITICKRGKRGQAVENTTTTTPVRKVSTDSSSSSTKSNWTIASCKSSHHSADTEPPTGTVESGKSTPAFRSFSLYCPNGYGIKSIRVMAKVDRGHGDRTDTTYSIKCEKLPLHGDIASCPVRREELPFVEEHETREMSSSQSSCITNNGQFLCGLSGVYEMNRRKLSATCCTIENVFPLKHAEPVLGDPSDAGAAEIQSNAKDRFVVNLDQLAGGAMVGHMTTFGMVVMQQGESVPSSDGCHCKCPCKCPLDKNGHKSSNGEIRRRRDMASKTDCRGIECACKCLQPCEKQ